MNRKQFLVCFLLTTTSILFAQNIGINTHIDSTTIWIGDQTRLSLEVTQQPEQHVSFPYFSDTIIAGLEIVAFSTDTIPTDGNNICVKHQYTLTAFEDSLYYLPPWPFVENGDTFWSKSLFLNVIQPFEIDTTQLAITDIKDIYKPKIYWWGIIRIVLIVMGALALIAASWWLYQKLKKKQSGRPIFEKSVPKRPAYEVAMEALDKIKAEKLWQYANRQKEYHTQLTDTVRIYINDRFNISSTEMTSYEILDVLLSELSHQKATYEKLKQLLTLADLVKFAKWSATTEENERSLQNAYSFVKDTHLEESTETEDVSDNLKS